ncbi:hypothetical protein Mgra_00008174 [Meloidogyne graminicola]|uniref:Uncharacterized protein n=1 Tax=Meloidogyne graminicola TaxID=189291 RepID=A0A8S9ZGG4_9BILA|nr:hypothetical protein Mgra_00008174 [Meloidogyne graminicola]
MKNNKITTILIILIIFLINSSNSEFQSLLIFTTRNEKEKGDENSPLSSDELEWHKINSFQSSINDFGKSFWKIYLLRGESEPLFKDIEIAIQYDDKTKVIVGNSQSQIIDKIFQSPFCWRKGKTEQLAFVMCNRKLEFPLDERGWKINEKIEIGENTELKRRKEEEIIIKKEKGKSIWIDLFKFTNVPMVVSATTTTIIKNIENDEEKEIIKEEEQFVEEQKVVKKQRKSKRYNKKINEENKGRKSNEINNKNENNEDEMKVKENENINEEEENKEEKEGKINKEEDEKEDDEEKEEELERVKDVEEGNDDELKKEGLNEEGKEEEDDDEEDDEEKELVEENDREDQEEEINEEKEEEEEEEEENIEKFNSLSITDKKRKCRYRLSCYVKKGIIIPEKNKEKEQKEEINDDYISKGKRTLGGKIKVDIEKKATLKNAAKLAVKKVRKQEEDGEILRKQYSHDGEQVLADFWAELERKNRCKYRRSCYSSGKLPKIKQSKILQWLSNIGGKSGIWNKEIKNSIEKEENVIEKKKN